MAQLQEQRQQRAALMAQPRAQRAVQMARLQTEQDVDDELMGASLAPTLMQRFIN